MPVLLAHWTKVARLSVLVLTYVSARSRAAACAFSLNRRSSGVQSGSSGASIAACSFLPRFVLAALSIERFGEEEVRDDAVAGCRSATSQVLFRLLVAAAEQPRHLVVPAAERAVGGPL